MVRFASVFAIASLVAAWTALAAPESNESPSRGEKCMAHRASSVIGMAVQNSDGQELGTVEDLVVDLNDGSIQYAALSFGGFLGVGDKLFAIPWEEFTASYDTGADEQLLLLNIDKATLAKAPGFDKDHWPNVGDEKWSDAVDAYYSAHRKTTRQRR